MHVSRLFPLVLLCKQSFYAVMRVARFCSAFVLLTPFVVCAAKEAAVPISIR